MLEKLEPIGDDKLDNSIGISMSCDCLVNANKLKAVAPLLPCEDGESRAVCLYFSDDFNTPPDLLIATSGQEETDNFIEQLEKVHKKNHIRVIK